MTNIDCEGVFSGLGNDCKRAGGSTSLETISNKIVVASNKLYEKKRWTQLTDEERRKKFRWARGSKEAKEVKKWNKNLERKL